MKKWTFYVLSFLLVTAVFGPYQKAEAYYWVPDYGADEIEPNNSVSNATGMETGQYMKGKFQAAQDIDTYSFDIHDDSNKLLIDVDVDPGIQPQFKLFDHNHNQLEPTFTDVHDSYQLLEFDLSPSEPGVIRSFYVEVTERDGKSSDARYGWTPVAYEEHDLSIERIAGNNRYETSVAVSQTGWPDGAENVIIARDITFPDALAGAPLGYQLDAPILLNPKDKLHETIEYEIDRLGASTVTILGGENAISKSVEDYLRNTMKLTVKRIAGANRYETAAKIAGQLEGYDQAMVVDGGNYPDALSAAPYAAALGMPILLTKKDELPDPTKAALKGVSETYAIGGPSAISISVKNELPGATRITGLNRYETSVNVAKEFDVSGDAAFLATGENFADALSGSVLAAFLYEPILLVKTHEIPQVTKEYLVEKGTYDYTILGGESALSFGVLIDIYSLFEEM
ncbi:cell wall-binding repeat-containing protein [Bacillus salacetis]|uniref:cell wall-binding repeat-containing protein n=1 Tax=Bacillus salacetis TaxID=2315464 RepID=UPI003BA22827